LVVETQATFDAVGQRDLASSSVSNPQSLVALTALERAADQAARSIRELVSGPPDDESHSRSRGPYGSGLRVLPDHTADPA